MDQRTHPPYRLIWFQHFHKAAGTSVVELARRNGERFHPLHDNGIPLDDEGHPLPLWRYPLAQLAAFVDECEAQRVSFVATEWGVPALEALAADPRVVLVTCLREPLSRLVSNFYYDLYGGYTGVRCLEAYPESSRAPFCRHNYYCRMLAGKAQAEGEIDAADFLRARERLASFAYCGVVERGLMPLARHLEWNPHAVHENRSDSALRLLKDFRRGRYAAVRRLFHPRELPGAAFRSDFARLNAWDLRLYALVEGAGGQASPVEENHSMRTAP
jgi:hypothetical protein